MKIKTLYVRFYRAFNYDYLRKSHPDSVPDPWDRLADDRYFPFIRVPLEKNITTVVGANESGKSQLLGAIKALLTGEAIEPRDFCRYSDFFSVSKDMKLPEFGGEFDDLDDLETATVRKFFDLAPEESLRSFYLFRMNSGIVVYAESKSGWVTKQVKQSDLRTLTLPSYFSIDSNTPLPDSVPLAYLTASNRTKQAPTRKQFLQWIEKLRDNFDWFGSIASFESAKPQIVEALASLNGSAAISDDQLGRRLELAEKLLVQVAGISHQAFAELQRAVRDHDGYANAIVSKMNDDLAKALNFPKWWSQDSEFSLSLTLRDFHLVFTVRDRTGSEYAFSERSGGMSYFLSYFVQYLSHVPRSGHEVLLMDEPDAYLSMTGQQDLLRIFESFAHPDKPEVSPIQVVYVTHSPFLIDKNHSERIRVLEKGDAENGTRLVSNAGRNHYEPLRSAFGAFVAETTFIGNCNLMIEGQADQVLLAGISSLARRSGFMGETLDLNSLSLVPAGSAEHIPYMVYLARGRDVDRPAVVALLDGDGEADRIADELRKGYRGRRFLEDSFIIQTSEIDPGVVSISTDAVREIEDLIPAEVALRAVHQFAHEVLPKSDAELVCSKLTSVAPAAGEKLYKAAERGCAELPEALRLDKVGFARAVLAVLEDDSSVEARDTVFKNFETLFALVAKAQREAVRNNGRERVERTVTRFRKSFFRDHPTTSTRRDANALLEDIDAQLRETTDETESMKAEIRMIRRDFHLVEEAGSPVEGYEEFIARLNQLTYGGVRAVQTESVLSSPIRPAHPEAAPSHQAEFATTLSDRCTYRPGGAP